MTPRILMPWATLVVIYWTGVFSGTYARMPKFTNTNPDTWIHGLIGASTGWLVLELWRYARRDSKVLEDEN